jgi:hypothetical protein
MPCSENNEQRNARHPTHPTLKNCTEKKKRELYDHTDPDEARGIEQSGKFTPIETARGLFKKNEHQRKHGNVQV